ncbi:MAG: alpha-L-fucosidase [Flavobacteriaceae bacterium]
MNTIKICISLIVLMVAIASCKQKPQGSQIIDESNMAAAIQDEALQKWQDQKFSMFIHWGIYSIPAGIWEGEQITGYSEQIKGHAKISDENYKKLSHQFNPTAWDPDSIALLAKEAGMKSVVITSKHHDGFAMFNTAYSDYNVIDATPYKRDVIKELSEACKRYGLGFGVYFSIIDWDFPEAVPFTSTHNSDPIPPAHHQYNLNQVEELLTNYGDISEIWFDMGAPTQKQSQEMAQLVKNLQPDCMISGRIFNDQGDFVVLGDNVQPDFKMDTPWQTPASMFDETWSYRSWQERGDVDEKVKEKIHDLVTIVSFGGNYLLNIGPTAEGEVIDFEKEVLKKIGAWMQVNGESIYESQVAAVQQQDWGVVTSKPGKLFFHVLDFPQDGHLVVKGMNLAVKNIYPLAQKDLFLDSAHENGNLSIDLTDEIIKNEHNTVFVAEYEGELVHRPNSLIDGSIEGEIALTAENAENYHSFSGPEYRANLPTVVRLKWDVANLNPSADYQVVVSAKEGRKNEDLILTVNNEVYPISFQDKHMVTIKVNRVKNGLNSFEIKRKDRIYFHKGLDFINLKMEIETL